MRTIVDDTDTTATVLRGAEVIAGNIGGRLETDTVKELLTDGEASALNIGGVTDEHRTPGSPDASGRACRAALERVHDLRWRTCEFNGLTTTFVDSG